VQQDAEICVHKFVGEQNGLNGTVLLHLDENSLPPGFFMFF
jgi:hypothetical protein